MLKFLVFCLLWIGSCPIETDGISAVAQFAPQLPRSDRDALARDWRGSQPLVSLDDGQSVTNQSILGPTGELLEPWIATQTLTNGDYVEWCLRWNKLQDYLAKIRTIPPRTIRGWVTKRHGFSQGVTGGFGRATGVNHLYNSTTESQQRVWSIGGYGGGPVTIYNPFVTR